MMTEDRWPDDEEGLSYRVGKPATDPRAALASLLARFDPSPENAEQYLAERGVLLVSKPGLRQLIRARVLPFVKDADAFADGIIAALSGEVTDVEVDQLPTSGKRVPL